ncbi:MAG: ADOP family duplicated permease [Acidobacteriota bacterium]
MGSILYDLRFAIRVVRKNPGASLVIILTLGLGLGINTTFFSAFHSMVLAPLPFEEPERLTKLYFDRVDEGRGYSPASGDFFEWRDGQDVFEELGAFRHLSFNVHSEELPERVLGAGVTGGLFQLLGVAPAQGRGFRPSEDAPGGSRVAVVSHQLWRESLGGAPDVLGSTLRLDGVPHEIVGVMPPGFEFPFDQHLWTPLQMDPASDERLIRGLEVLGRLRDGVDVAEAEAAMAPVAALAAERHPEEREGWIIRVQELRPSWLPPVTQVAAMVMQGLVSLVLLIVCVNVASMVLAQATARRHETALRTALGADRGRLLRQALTESLLLASAGGALGLLLAAWSSDWVTEISATPVPYWLEFGIHRDIVLFCLLLTLLAGTAIGVLPALRRQRRTAEDLRSGGRGDTGTGGGRLRRGLVVAEYAMAVVIVAGALLMVRSYASLEAQDSGFDTDGLFTFQAGLQGTGYEDPAQGLDYLERALLALEGLPQVTSAAVANRLPISQSGHRLARIEVDGQPKPRGEEPVVTAQAVSAGYFDTLGIPLRFGRTFQASELEGGAPVAILGEGLAQRLWPGSDAVGRRLRELDGPWLRVVGVVGNVDPGEPIAGVDGMPSDQIYRPLSAVPPTAGGERADPGAGYAFLSTTPTLVVRAQGSVDALVPEIRRVLVAVDPEVPMFETLSMDQVLRRYYFAQHIWSRMFAVIAAVALAIAAVGAYGVTSYSVSRRIREMGVRLALGAQPADLMTRVVAQGLGTAVLGLALGLVAAIPMSAAMSALLHGVGLGDPLVLGGIVALLLLVATAACILPARRAAAVDPIVALRQD